MSTAVGLSVRLDMLRNWSVSNMHCGESVLSRSGALASACCFLFLVL